MLRKAMVIVSMLLVVGVTIDAATAQTTPTESQPSRLKLTAGKLKDMKAKWSANKPKLKACRKEVRSKGLAGDERWFYIADCMEKS
jgi:hypothetical protein